LGKETQGKKAELIDRILLSAGTWDFFVPYAAIDFDACKVACDALAEKYKIWPDNKEVKAGDNILDSIRKGVIESFAAIIFVSDNYNERQYTSYELELLSKFHKPKIPVVSNDKKSAIHPYFDKVNYFVWKDNNDELLKEVDRVYAQVKLA
jgi:hypothetical protein